MEEPLNFQKVFFKKVTEKRKELNIFQEELAQRAEVSVDTIKRYERDVAKNIYFNTACRIAAALKIALGSWLPAAYFENPVLINYAIQHLESISTDVHKMRELLENEVER